MYSSPPPYSPPGGFAGVDYSTVQPPPPLAGSPAPPAWDPYAGASSQPPTLTPYNDFGAAPTSSGPAPPGFSPQRFLQDVSFQETWLEGHSGTDFDVHTLDLSASFGFPLFQNPSLVLVSPGFAFNWWEGPRSDAFVGSPDLPSRAYDAYLDTSWTPVFSPTFGADLGVRVGVYSDFENVNSDSLRVTGRALALLTLNERWRLAAGVVYLDRLRVKLLPAGGLIWTPNADRRWDLVFPSPKLASRLTTWGNTDLWGYLGAEYGGGQWTVERADGSDDLIDYNDIRVFVGLETIGFRGFTGHFDVGYVFDREILYRSATPDVEPDDTIMLRAGLSY